MARESEKTWLRPSFYFGRDSNRFLTMKKKTKSTSVVRKSFLRNAFWMSLFISGLALAIWKPVIFV
ncbi:hypothetical protein EBS43_05220 [bacterium]|nr:hypothetical protein [bacterium]